MRFHEIIAERSLADVGVRAERFYLAGKSEHIDWDKFLSSGKLDGIKGVSSSRDIWKDFGPNMGRDVLFIMPAQTMLRLNKVHRVGYDNVDDLVANNSYKIGRILSINNVSRNIGDNLVMGCFPKQAEFRSSDPISVMNNSMSIASYLRRGEDPTERFPGVDASTFDWSDGLRLSSVDDYANLYLQGAKASGWYGKEYVKFFAPQNRKQWYPAISAAIIKQANVYADEAEWIVDSPEFTVPPDAHVILAIPQKYQDGPPPEEDKVNSWFWTKFDDERYAAYQTLLNAFKKSRYKFSVVEAGRAANSLLSAQTRKRERTYRE